LSTALYGASTSTLYLTTSLSSGYAECTVAIGHPGACVPLIGCWTTGDEMSVASVQPTASEAELTATAVDQIDLAALAATELESVALLNDLGAGG